MLGKLLEKGYVYRGLKPVNWCFDCGSALAEAEVEYEDRKDPAIDVGFAFAGDRDKVAKAFNAQASDKPGYAVIWTTTPWTLPANQALNVHPELTYDLVDTEKGLLILAAELQEACLKRYGLAGQDRWGAARARRSRTSAFAIRSTIASRRSISASTSRSIPAPASCIPRPPTAWRTSSPAGATA